MKANEFRVGNLLDKDGSIVIVDAETILKFQCQLKECERYQAIHLTEEWLLKFQPMEHYDKGYEIEFMFKGGVYIRENKSKGIFCFGETPLPYVHLFQNLYFALTGQEL